MKGHSRHHLGGDRPLTFSILTTTDSRTVAEDVSGRAVREAIEGLGHSVLHTALVGNSPAMIRRTVRSWLKEGRTHAIVTIGGTGLGRRDRTVTTIERMGGEAIVGFGEAFRRLSFDQVGALSLMSRSTAFILGRRLIFCLPGSTSACKLALDELILPAVGHMVGELERE